MTQRTYPNLASNGIVISGNAYDSTFVGELRAPESPSLIEMAIARNLQRTGLQTKSMPFANELAKSITTDLVAFAAVNGPKKGEDAWLDGTYPGFRRSSYL